MFSAITAVYGLFNRCRHIRVEESTLDECRNGLLFCLPNREPGFFSHGCLFKDREHKSDERLFVSTETAL